MDRPYLGTIESFGVHWVLIGKLQLLKEDVWLNIFFLFQRAYFFIENL